jgi:signal transduction histidine kinase
VISKLFALLVLCTPLIGAQGQKLSQMIHTSWVAEDGAPQGIQAITQTPDGLLWISSLGGLYTFDGLTFSRFHPAEESRAFFAQNFHYLFASRNGDLWLFGFHGFPARLHQGEVTIFDRVKWSGAVEEFKYPQEESNGKLWAVLNERQLVWLSPDGVWHPDPCPENGSGHITALYVDSADTTWLVVNDRLYRHATGHAGFEATPTVLYADIDIHEGMHGDLWVASSGNAKEWHHPIQHLHHLDGSGNELPAPDIREPLLNVLPGSDDSLWVLTGDAVLSRLSAERLRPGPAKSISEIHDQIHLTVGSQISASRTFLRGLDGGVWLAGLGGLERFATATLIAATPKAAIGNWRSCIDPNGALWINDPNEALYRWVRDRPPHPIETGVGGMFCSADGTILLRDERGLAVLKNGHVSRLPSIPALRRYSNHYLVTGATRTGDGRILAAVSGRVIGYSLWAFTKGKWQTYLAGEKIPEVSAMFSDRKGRLLLGFRGSDQIGLVENDRLRLLDTGRPGIRSTMGFAETSQGLFAYGSNGIAVETRSHFRMLLFARPDHATTVMGLVEVDNRDVWMASKAGIVKVASGEIQHALVDPLYHLSSNEDREGDVAGPSIPELFSSKAHLDRKGLVWFTTLNGIVSVDPTTVAPSPPPRLSIRSIRADSHSADGAGAFPPNIRALAIDYIGIDFKDPRGVRYRYKLDGFDAAWQDADSRTEALYTYLGPGRYRFEVMAANASGVWTAPVVSSQFTILPRFYQRIEFQLLCVLSFLILVWLIVRARLKYIENAIREKAEERADERIRIARDLHDTLLQGVQGLLLNFHSAAERVPDGHDSKPVLERALATADKIILEGRDRVKGLRQQDFTSKELCSALSALGDDLNVSGKIEYSVRCMDGKKTLTAHVASEVFLIAREAVMNAFRHADATRISVWVDYGQREFTLHCDDNGQGIESADGRRGHWGLRGMSERADRLRAAFEVKSIPQRGTSVRLTLRARRAYE